MLQIQSPLRSEKNAFSVPEGGNGETTKKGHIQIMEIAALSEPHAHRPRQKSATGRKEREVVVITGASAGVGRAAVRAFASRGACIGLLARGADGLEAAKREVEALGGRALVCVTDTAEAEQVEAAAEAVEARLGPIDIWVNNAMVSVFSPVVEMKPEEYKRVTEVTYLGYVWGTLAALKRMRPRNKGVIIQVGSALAYRGIPLQSAYCASKHAIQGFVDSLRTELLHERSKVRVCMVQMPALNTPQFRWVRSRLPNKAQPVPPIFQPEVAADAIVYAATHHRRELYVGAPTVAAIIGNKIAPGFADWYLAKKGYRSQEITGEPEENNRPDNLMKPLPGDHGAHGVFDDRARDFSWQWWADKNRRGLLSLAAGLLWAGWLLARRSQGRRLRPHRNPKFSRSEESRTAGYRKSS
jgi:NAD(P)-dependent dehydrogenase (short-subunit alcohol dehydrogenase family)